MSYNKELNIIDKIYGVDIFKNGQEILIFIAKDSSNKNRVFSFVYNSQYNLS